MDKNQKGTIDFTTMTVGLLIGFFLGAGIVYSYFSRLHHSSLINKQYTEDRAGTSKQSGTRIVSEGHTSPFQSKAYNIDRNEPAPASIDNIQVRQDQLIGVKRYVVSMPDNSPAVSNNTRILDSLMGSSAHNKSTDILHVEFWESPLQYSAYKMSKNRVILFGITQIDLVSIQKANNKLYIRYLDHYYPLTYTSDFLALIPESNPKNIQLLEQLWP